MKKLKITLYNSAIKVRALLFYNRMFRIETDAGMTRPDYKLLVINMI